MFTNLDIEPKVLIALGLKCKVNEWRKRGPGCYVSRDIFLDVKDSDCTCHYAISYFANGFWILYLIERASYTSLRELFHGKDIVEDIDKLHIKKRPAKIGIE